MLVITVADEISLKEKTMEALFFKIILILH